MAKPIKETPILRGKDARRFIEDSKTEKNPTYIQTEKRRILDNYNRLKQAEKFTGHIPA